MSDKAAYLMRSRAGEVAVFFGSAGLSVSEILGIENRFRTDHYVDLERVGLGLFALDGDRRQNAHENNLHVDAETSPFERAGLDELLEHLAGCAMPDDVQAWRVSSPEQGSHLLVVDTILEATDVARTLRTIGLEFDNLGRVYGGSYPVGEERPFDLPRLIEPVSGLPSPSLV